MLGDAEARDVEAQAAVEAEAAGAGTVFGAMGGASKGLLAQTAVQQPLA